MPTEGALASLVMSPTGMLEAWQMRVMTSGEVRATLDKITERFDAGDTEPVFFGSHRRVQAVLVPIATWEKLLAHAEDAVDVHVARRRLADDQPWLSDDDLDAVLQHAAESATSPRRY